MTRKSPFTETMFADSFLETSWDQQTRRSWTTLTSFGLQVVIISLLLILPLLKNVALPSGRVLPTPLSWGAPPPPPVPPHQRSATVMQSNLADNVIIAPPSIPSHVAIIDEVAPPPQLSFNTWGVRGGTGTAGGRWSYRHAQRFGPRGSASTPPACPAGAPFPSFQHPRRQSDSPRAAELSHLGADRAYSGICSFVGGHQQSGHDREPAGSLGSPDAGRGSSRGCAPMALPAVHSEQRAG